ncbi:MAG: transporter [Betaproteobacteria bacterium RIFCSPLOWO2_12_FULL_63_13]|nr:MAG: transporter [Betaproteobacteria bacterium RIFCSPLOWO2_12_FULL_63_13]
MSDTLAALLPVFLLIVTGFVLRRSLLSEESHWTGIGQLVYFVMLPALLIDTLARADFARLPVGSIGGALLAAIAAMAAICLALRRPLASRLQIDGAAFTSLFQGATRWNAFVALAIAAGLFGNHGVALVSVAMLAMIPVLNVLNVWVLARYAAAKRPDWRTVVVALIRNPLIWSCAAGIALNRIEIAIPPPVHVFAEALGRSSLALALLMVGAGLRLTSLLQPSPAALLASVLKLVVLPALAIGAGHLMGLNAAGLGVVAITSSVPTAPVAYVLARQMGGDAELLAQILTMQTVLAALTIPIMISLAL